MTAPMNITLYLFMNLLLVPPILSHGSNDDCSTECNDYYCPPEMEDVKKNKFSESGLLDN